MKRCEKCRLRARFDNDPRSLLGRMWQWHTGWCPGWKSYLKSLPDEEKVKVIKRYSR